VRLCVAGFTLSHHTGRARKVVDEIVKAHPAQYESWYHFDTKGYRPFLQQLKLEFSPEQQEKFAEHKTSPFVWLEKSDGSKDAKGGRDRLCEWAIVEFKHDKAVVDLCSSGPGLSDAWVDESPGTANVSPMK
jgi:hypothetical protein